MMVITVPLILSFLESVRYIHYITGWNTHSMTTKKRNSDQKMILII